MYHRKKKRVLLMSVAFAFIGFFSLTAVPSFSVMGIKQDKSVNSIDDMIEEEEKQKLTNSEEKFDFEGTDFLQKNKYPEINKLIRDYYDAMFSYNLDSMESLVSDISKINFNLMRAKLEYMEKIDNIICYTVDGPSEGTFRIYVYYDLKIKGIDTLAPALSAFYITLSSDGSYVIYLNELDAEAQEFVDSADRSDDVKLLSALVSARFRDVVNNDDDMRRFYNMMEENSDEGSVKQKSEAATSEAVKAHE